MSDPGYYGPHSITWRLVRERAMLLGGPRALVLQLAHPLVGAGVAEHSSFRADPIQRLYRTLDATLGVVFGTTEEADAAAAQVKKVHGYVHGRLPADAGRFPAGTPYSAGDPELLLWVHATLIDTTLRVYPLLVGPLTPAEQERAYQESKIAARLFGAPDEVLPCSLEEFRGYFDEMIASDVIAAAPFQRELVEEVLYPPLRGVPKPAYAPGVAFTASVLPPRIRELYDLRLDPGRRRAARWLVRSVRGMLPLLPPAVRYMPHARRAYRRAPEGREG